MILERKSGAERAKGDFCLVNTNQDPLLAARGEMISKNPLFS